MNEAVAERTGAGGGLSRTAVTVAAVVLALFVADRLAGWLPWLGVYPGSWELPVSDWVSDAMEWLLQDAAIGGIGFRSVVRSLATLLSVPLEAGTLVLAKGFELPFADGGVMLPALSWLGVAAALVLFGARIGGRRLATLLFFTVAYLAFFGQWQSAMTTIASILVAVPVGLVLGLLLGLAAYRHPAFERVLRPVLDLMQTVPIFAYLVPVLVLFGFGPVAAVVATVIYAMPPMARVTIVALRGVSEEILEFARMSGCTRRQLTWRVLVPAARQGLMVGVNQVIMLSLNMVIIASMIGAGGLGYDVLRALRRLQIGDGLEAGVAITLIAIATERLGRALTDGTRSRPRLPRRHFALLLAAVVALPTIAGVFWSPLAGVPDALTVSTAEYWGRLVAWVNTELYGPLNGAKSVLLVYVLIPFKRALVALPWTGVVAALAVLSHRLGGWRLAAGVTALALFIAVTGNWEKAMITVYLCGISVAIAALIGIPLGIWSAASDRVHRVTTTVVDTLQTLPSFVYLIPVVMLFQVGDFSAMVAIVLYALAPAVRYTDHGIRGVPAETIEAARMCGCTRGQIRWRVQLPLALPEIMLGLNQTIMMALSMLVITALVGTRDLGQEVYIALTRADIGAGLVAGLCVAFIAMIADRLIGAWVARRRAALGLA
ncbi:hypothetical protein KBTX_02374 [wastewater metagenome]|uniref:ABC transmembrane type-1 domain-containing protein n=4 Tax=root TaxID=1 RepID=A0A5B8RGR0_9ZZZZ|nr:ABC transporter permease subunit [Arhodomonas aquaeolei]MCS4503056.1 ABC transporter permease subunit [Arhodomonas aquaeolei]QEA06045.1 hypothetical protein KBTEX_02374 [uncultured organism]